MLYNSLCFIVTTTTRARSYIVNVQLKPFEAPLFPEEGVQQHTQDKWFLPGVTELKLIIDV